jgi:hypothetical protein
MLARENPDGLPPQIARLFTDTRTIYIHNLRFTWLSRARYSARVGLQNVINLRSQFLRRIIVQNHPSRTG